MGEEPYVRMVIRLYPLAPPKKEVILKKSCTKCHFEKPFEMFNDFKRSKDGLRPWCKECTKSYSKTYRIKFPEKVRLQKSASYQKNKSYYIKLTSEHSKKMLRDRKSVV